MDRNRDSGFDGLDEERDVIAAVQADSRAARAGLLPGDMLGAINTNPVRTAADFARLQRSPLRREIQVWLIRLFPNLAETISAIILGSVLINEVAGPLLTKLAIARAGETRAEHVAAFEEL